VADHRRRSEEGGKARERFVRGGRANEIGVANAGEARDDRGERGARVDEGAEALADGDSAVCGEVDARGADLDDAVAVRVETGGLEIEGDELQIGPRSSAAPRRGAACRSSHACLAPVVHP